jgi:hypothetical protein
MSMEARYIIRTLGHYSVSCDGICGELGIRTKKFLPTTQYSSRARRDFNVLQKAESSPNCGKVYGNRISSVCQVFWDTEARAMCNKPIEAVYQIPFTRSMCHKTPTNV